MLDILTTSGAIIRTDAEEGTPHRERINRAVELLGGILVQSDTDPHVDAVLSIIDLNVLGTSLIDEDGMKYLLTDEGWYSATEDREHEFLTKVPPFETVVAASIPGGWSWSR